MCVSARLRQKREEKGDHTHTFTHRTPVTPRHHRNSNDHTATLSTGRLGFIFKVSKTKMATKTGKPLTTTKNNEKEQQRQRQLKHHPTPRTTHTHTHTKPPQQPIEEPQQQRTLTNTTTMDTQHSTPSARDENMTEENTAALRDPRITPKPPNWPQMTKKQRRNWFKHKLGGREEEG